MNLSHGSWSIEFKVPRIEQDFLNDQRTRRIQFIGDVDIIETERIQKSQERKQKLITYYERESSQQFCQIEANSSIERDGSSEDDTVRVEKDSCIERDGSSDDDTVHVEKDSCERNYTSIPSIAEAVDIFNISNTAAAAIASATLVDFGIVLYNNLDKVIDKSKVWPERMKLRKNKVEIGNDNVHLPKSIYFDGKKDKTRVNMKTPVVEEHVVLVEERGSMF